MKNRIYNRIETKAKRRDLRKNMTQAESVLWRKIKGKQLFGTKFRRQFAIGKYIVDFYCPRYKLVIEVDGDSHYWNEEAKEYDRRRQTYIESYGIRFLRFTNVEIYQNIDGVLLAIEKEIEEIQNER